MSAPTSAEMDREYARRISEELEGRLTELNRAANPAVPVDDQLILARADTVEIFKAAVQLFPLTGGLDGGSIAKAVSVAQSIWLAVHR